MAININIDVLPNQQRLNPTEGAKREPNAIPPKGKARRAGTQKINCAKGASAFG